MVYGQLNVHMQNYEIGPLPQTILKISSKQIIHSIVRDKTIKLLEGKIAVNLSSLIFGNGLFNTPEAKAAKIK